MSKEVEVKVWVAFPDLRVRATQLLAGQYALEIWRLVGGKWRYLVVKEI